jgi:hypothetical protein
VTGPRALTFAEAADEIAEASGRPVGYLPITSVQFHAALTEEAEPDLLTEIFDGRNTAPADGVRQAPAATPGLRHLLPRRSRHRHPARLTPTGNSPLRTLVRALCSEYLYASPTSVWGVWVFCEVREVTRLALSRTPTRTV